MYGLDVHDDALMCARPWAWLRDHILGLLSRPFGTDLAGSPVFTTRLQSELFTPKPE